MKPELPTPNGMPMTKHKHIKIPADKKVYFVSDHHFGLPDASESLVREKRFVRWLDNAEKDAGAIFILGDMFDVWYEYKRAIPKGFVRVLGKLAHLSDKGIPIYFFVGNHDMWMRDYLEKELQIPIFFDPEIFYINDKKFLIGHGDGLGPGDKKYKLLKKLFRNKVAQWAFSWLHPDLGLRLAQYLSKENKMISGSYTEKSYGEKEWLYQYCQQYLQHTPDINFFVFGHRHLPLKMPLDNQAVYYNTGDWLTHFSHIEFEGDEMKLHK